MEKRKRCCSGNAGIYLPSPSTRRQKHSTPTSIAVEPLAPQRSAKEGPVDFDNHDLTACSLAIIYVLVHLVGFPDENGPHEGEIE
jgi:hypothetical protein